MVTGVSAATGVVAMLNAGELVAPPCTNTDVGTDATAELLLDRLTVAPACGAGPVSVTWLSARDLPPSTEARDSFTTLGVTGGLTVNENAAGGEVAPELSFTVTLKLYGLPVVVVGVPRITPVLGFSFRLLGRAPELTTQLL